MFTKMFKANGSTSDTLTRMVSHLGKDLEHSTPAQANAALKTMEQRIKRMMEDEGKRGMLPSGQAKLVLRAADKALDDLTDLVGLRDIETMPGLKVYNVWLCLLWSKANVCVQQSVNNAQH